MLCPISSKSAHQACFRISRILIKTNQNMKAQDIYPITENQQESGQTTHVTISFQNLTYKVLAPIPGSTQKGFRTILNNLTGVCLPGQITAILGASGAGKTSLLNILAKRISMKSGQTMLEGEIQANRAPYNADRFAQFAAYVMQNDILFGTLTVREAFQFVANLKYRDPKEKAERVHDTIKTLMLEKCADTLIGNAMIKGISGGERKRTSIGVELVNDPYCILLDEPTSGLDSFTAFVIINLLKKLAHSKKRTIVFTIHQPSSDIFQLLDQVMLLVQGQFIYQGIRDEIVSYFASLSYKCPEHSNPLDYLMGIMHADNPNHANFNLLFEAYQAKVAPGVHLRLQEASNVQIQRNTTQTSFFFQTLQICRRGMINVQRDKLVVRGRIAMTIFIALFMGGVYWGVGRKTQGFAALQSMAGVLFFLVMSSFMGSLNPVMIQFPAEREVFLREENAKLYTTASYFLGKSSVEFPFLMLFPIIQQLIMYWMVGLNDATAEIVVINIFICFLLGFSGNSVGLMAGSMFKDVRTASGMLPMVLMPLVLFSGFYANQSQLMSWIGWLQYISPMKYAFEALMRNEYTGYTPNKNFLINNPDPIEFYDFSLGMWESIGILIAFIIAYRVLALVFLSLLREKQQ